MDTTRINGLKIEFYNSIEELPITRFNKYNRNVMIDAGIGGDLSAADEHIRNALVYFSKGEKTKASQELMNFRQNLAFIVENTNPQMHAFVCLIKSIDGKELVDLSPENITRTPELLSDKGVTVGFVYDQMEKLKKKLMLNLRSFSRRLRTTRK